MGQSVWNGKRWRRVSDVEARFRRAQGFEVRTDAPAPLPPAPQPVAKLSELPMARPVFALTPDSPAEMTDAELDLLTSPGGEG